MLAPLKIIVSLPCCPSTTSLPSPGSHWNVSLPLPRNATSAPRLPSAKSFPSPPMSVSAPSPPSSRVVPAPAVDRERGQRGEAVLAGDRVVSAEAVDAEILGDRVHGAGSSAREDDRRRCQRSDPDHVVLVRALGDRRVGAVTAVELLDQGSVSRLGRERVVAAESVRGEHVGRLLAGDRDRRPQPGDTGLADGARADVDGIRSGCPVLDHRVDRAVAGSVAGGEVGADALDVGAAQVVDGERVGAAEGVDGDGLDAVGVHGDVGDVAEQAQPVTVGGQVDLLGDVGAVEDHRVVARPVLRRRRCRRRDPTGTCRCRCRGTPRPRHGCRRRSRSRYRLPGSRRRSPRGACRFRPDPRESWTPCP